MHYCFYLYRPNCLTTCLLQLIKIMFTSTKLTPFLDRTRMRMRPDKNDKERGRGNNIRKMTRKEKNKKIKRRDKGIIEHYPNYLIL